MGLDISELCSQMKYSFSSHSLRNRNSALSNSAAAQTTASRISSHASFLFLYVVAAILTRSFSSSGVGTGSIKAVLHAYQQQTISTVLPVGVIYNLPVTADEPPRRRVTEYLSAAEIRALTTRSDRLGLRALLLTWASIAACFALVAWHPRWWTIALALVFLGGRQLALSILMHDAAHRSLFRSRRLNLVLGEWLCAAPIWTSLERYRAHHLQHHAHTNDPRDPDLGLVAPFPVTPASMARKFTRDLLGLTGLRRVVALLAIDFGFLEYTASAELVRIDQRGRSLTEVLGCGLRNFGPVLLSNVALGLMLRAAGHGELYLLWVVAYLTSFSLLLRIRSMAEHACTDATTDPFFNTRTTQAGWLARLTVAPLAVNFHLEHHLLPTVPLYSLPRMHHLLHERGALDGCHIASGYIDVLRSVTRRSDA